MSSKFLPNTARPPADIFPLLLPLKVGARTNPRLGMLASLDHAMCSSLPLALSVPFPRLIPSSPKKDFYDDTVDASEFLLFWMECPIVRSGRGTVQGRIYKRDGTLAVLVVRFLLSFFYSGGKVLTLIHITSLPLNGPADTRRSRAGSTRCQAVKPCSASVALTSGGFLKV